MEKQSINMPVAIAGVKRMKPSTFHREREFFDYYLKHADTSMAKICKLRNVTMNVLSTVVSKGFKENWANHKKMKV